MIRKELSRVALAFASYTRLYIPYKYEYSEENMTAAFRYFPLVGTVIGGITATLYWGLGMILPILPTTLLSLALMLIITGAMHEDGFADLCDGMGGGHTPQRRLEIMKDSRLGVFAVIGLILAIGYRTSCWVALSERLWLLLPIALTWSRFFPILLINQSHYARKEASKGDYTRRRIPLGSFVIALLWCLPGFVVLPIRFSLLFVPVSLLATWGYRKWLENRIGGFTGDTLGALQLLMELLFYTLFMSVSHLSTPL